MRLLVLLLLLTVSTSLADDVRLRCIQNILSTYPEWGAIRVENGVLSADEVGTELEFYTEGKLLGHIKYTRDGSHLDIDYVTIFPIDRGKKLSEVFLYEALKRNPGIKSIAGKLSGTNLEAFLTTFKGGQSPRDAIKNTPAYKIRAAMGYSKINWEKTVVNPKTSYIYLVTEQP